jgi:hypothetical protein
VKYFCKLEFDNDQLYIIDSDEQVFMYSTGHGGLTFLNVWCGGEHMISRSNTKITHLKKFLELL